MAPYNFAACRRHVEVLLNYTFADRSLLEEALHAGGPIIINGKLVQEGNKRLAMIGDSALHLALAITDYHSEFTRGEISNRCQSVASNENLSSVGTTNGIDNCTRLNLGTGTVSLKTRAMTMEAILGAVYLDSGDWDVVRRCMGALGLQK